jgi:hypothetical protein
MSGDSTKEWVFYESVGRSGDIQSKFLITLLILLVTES